MRTCTLSTGWLGTGKKIRIIIIIIIIMESSDSLVINNAL